MSGTFSHPSGTIQNSVWLDGTFENGTFRSSSFNPYVTRNIFSQPLSGQAFSISDTCIWKNGNLVDSDFYISNWENGNFISGNGYGMIWKNGIVSYMNAYNIFWENGLWKNGNWYGSSFNLNTDGSITNDFAKQILFRGMNWGGTSSCHVWNVFYNESLSDVNSYIDSPANNVAWSPDPNAIAVNTPPIWLGNSTFGANTPVQPVAGITIVYSDTNSSADRTGTSGMLEVLLTVNSLQTTQNAEWQYIKDNQLNWTSYSPVTSNTNLYDFADDLITGIIYFRIEDGSLHSNVLKYTRTSSGGGGSGLTIQSSQPNSGSGTLNFQGGEPNEVLTLNFTVTADSLGTFDGISFTSPVSVASLDSAHLTRTGTITLNSSGTATSSYQFSPANTPSSCLVTITARSSSVSIPTSNSTNINNN